MVWEQEFWSTEPLAGDKPETWRIELFGGLRAVRGSQVHERFRTHKTGSLLAYLAYYMQQSHSREKLVELFWPGGSHRSSRSSLSVAISSLRDQLDDVDEPEKTIILANRGLVSINPQVVTTDVGEFETAVSLAMASIDTAPEDEQVIHLLSCAVQQYRPELLSGCYEPWIMLEQQRLSELYFTAALRLIERLAAVSRYSKALEFASRAIQIDPLREEFYGWSMQLFAAMGQHSAAVRHYRELERVLSCELNVRPSPGSRFLFWQIEHLAARGSEEPMRISHPAIALSVARQEQRPRSQTVEIMQSPLACRSVAILYKRGVKPDDELVELLEASLSQKGHQVFVDRYSSFNVKRAQEIERQIRAAELVIPLLSAASIESEMMEYEIHLAYTAAQEQGHPRLAPVRVRYGGALPPSLAAILAPVDYLRWKGRQDNPTLVEAVLHLLEEDLSRSRVEPVLLEAVGGAVPLDSRFYIVRPSDIQFLAALSRQDGLVLLKGPRQMGKTSLLARGLQGARETGSAVLLTDFQKFSSEDLETPNSLFMVLAASLVEQLDLDVLVDQVWDVQRSSVGNFERFLRREIMDRISGPLIWGMDEVDRLFQCSFCSELFAFFRSLYNERALNPGGPWSRLVMAVAYATEAHLFISDLNLSPFNVGTQINLKEFSIEEVTDLNERYGSPLKTADEIARYYYLVGGHPYLARRGLNEMSALKMDIAAFESQAAQDEGLFGDHLRRILALLAQDAELCQIVRGLLQGKSCPTPESFYRLRSAGIISDEIRGQVRLRCQLYSDYLGRHLL